MRHCSIYNILIYFIKVFTMPFCTLCWSHCLNILIFTGNLNFYLIV